MSHFYLINSSAISRAMNFTHALNSIQASFCLYVTFLCLYGDVSLIIVTYSGIIFINRKVLCFADAVISFSSCLPLPVEEVVSAHYSASLRAEQPP